MERAARCLIRSEIGYAVSFGANRSSNGDWRLRFLDLSGADMTCENADDGSELDRISRIQTQWSLLQQAHQPLSPEQAQQARAAVVQRYISPIYRYLRRIMRNADAAEDVAHDIVLKLLQGQMSGATPDRGRFRDYLKTVLINAARSWQTKNVRNQMVSNELEDKPIDTDDREFDSCVRSEVMQAAWKDLEESERRTKQPVASVLRWRTTVASTSTEGLQTLLLQVTGRQYTGDGARKLLQRSRDEYAQFVLEQVRQLLPPDQRDKAALEEELLALGLHDTCRRALQ